jgi:hypothetical protein
VSGRSAVSSRRIRPGKDRHPSAPAEWARPVLWCGVAVAATHPVSRNGQHMLDYLGMSVVRSAGVSGFRREGRHLSAPRTSGRRLRVCALVWCCSCSQPTRYKKPDSNVGLFGMSVVGRSCEFRSCGAGRDAPSNLRTSGRRLGVCVLWCGAVKRSQPTGLQETGQQ